MFNKQRLIKMATKRKAVQMNETDHTKEVVEMNENVNEAVETEIQDEAQNVMNDEEENESFQTSENDVPGNVIEAINELNVEQVKAVISYCKVRLEDLQQEEIAQLEEQMRTIQERLMNMKGGAVLFPQVHRETRKKGLMIENPENTSEIYKGFGKRPDWLSKLLEPAQGDKVKEREIMERLAKKD
jgi:23S rRNA A1618 N6-methylase RlmF